MAAPMFLILLLMVLLSGLLHGMDLIVQGTCRAIHDDQPFIVETLVGKLPKNNFFIPIKTTCWEYFRQSFRNAV